MKVVSVPFRCIMDIFHNKPLKVGLLIFSILGLIISVILIPLNIFAVNFAEWVPMLIGILSLIGIVSYLMIFKSKLYTKIILPIVFVIAIIFLSMFPYAFPYWNSCTFKGVDNDILNYDDVITYDVAKKDLDEAIHYLKKTHPMFMDGLTQEVKDSYDKVLADLKSDGEITVNDLRRAIQSVVNPMHDAHTTTYNNYPRDRYLKVIPEKSYGNYKIVTINGLDRESIFEIAKKYYSYETEAWINIDFGSLATLDFYGFSSPYKYVWRNADGNRVTETYTQNDFVTWSEYLEIRKDYFPSQDEKEDKHFVSYEIDGERSLAVLTLASCEYNNEYIDTLKNMFNDVKAKSIKNVAVDLRGNGGGNSMVADEFIRYLPIDEYKSLPCDIRYGFISIKNRDGNKNRPYKDMIFSGNVYIMTDSNSFSAAKDFAMMIQDNDLGKVIGQSPANKVNGYGDVALFQLKNTGLLFQISTKKWYRSDPENKDEYVIPDYPSASADVYETLYSIIAE